MVFGQEFGKREVGILTQCERKLIKENGFLLPEEMECGTIIV